MPMQACGSFPNSGDDGRWAHCPGSSLLWPFPAPPCLSFQLQSLFSVPPASHTEDLLPVLILPFLPNPALFSGSPLPMGALVKLPHFSWAAILSVLWSPGLWRFSHSTPSVSITQKSHQTSYLQSLEQVAHTTWGGRADPLSTERHISEFYLQIFYISFILISIHECFIIDFEPTFIEHLLCAESHCIYPINVYNHQ